MVGPTGESSLDPVSGEWTQTNAPTGFTGSVFSQFTGPSVVGNGGVYLQSEGVTFHRASNGEWLSVSVPSGPIAASPSGSMVVEAATGTAIPLP